MAKSSPEGMATEGPTEWDESHWHREMMLIYDDIFAWEGWGGKLRLASGRCRLRIYDLRRGGRSDLAHLRPYILIVSDVSNATVGIRSCAGHIATKVTTEFGIDPQRMLYIEHYPARIYGERQKFEIAERYDAVEFSWQKGRAISPRWRTLEAPLVDMVKSLEQRPEPSE